MDKSKIATMGVDEIRNMMGVIQHMAEKTAAVQTAQLKSAETAEHTAKAKMYSEGKDVVAMEAIDADLAAGRITKEQADERKKLLGTKSGANKLNGAFALTEEQNSLLTKAISDGRLDPNHVNSRTAIIYANLLKDNPSADMSGISADIALSRNAGFRTKKMTADILPEIMRNMVDSGKKLDFSRISYAGKLEAWKKGALNDPDFIEYMTQRNDALMTITSVMRQNGATDKSIELELEAAPVTMTPDAFEAWYRGQMKSLAPRIKQMAGVTDHKGTKPDAAPAAGGGKGTAQSVIDKFGG